jgi:superfamily I DNA/RNA helicase/mRNA-degrading endonuclease RelE of RelBE toxin-antitoxin system
MNQHQPTMAISSDFFTAYDKLPHKIQNKTISFLSKFRQDPTLPGINYEKIQDAGNPCFRSVRIDDTYRGIVLKNEDENVYVLLWVDNHDQAYAWARRKKCAVHPDTGSLQVYEAVQTEPEKTEDQEVDPESETTPGLFAHIRDRHLTQLGVPQELLPRVRKIATQEDLENMLGALPQEAYEGLFFLAEGFSVQEIFQEMDRSGPSKEVDTEDIRTALDNVDSKQRFYVVTDDLELQAMFQAPLEKWRVFLHSTQRKLVERDWNGPVRVLGEAGTGKTVAAMHRAKWLVRKAFSGNKDWILLTTFTKNLAADIQENLRSICSTSELERIEVVNLDKWVSDFLKRCGYSSTIVYSDQTDSLWELALTVAPEDTALSASFYREEWENVLQPQGVTTFVEYCQASRKGRGVPLNRKTRKAIWPVFEEYRLQLSEHGWREPDDAMRDARHILQSQDIHLPYSSIVVDEAQDMGSQAFMLLRQMVPERANDLFIVGDGHQRIYRHKVILGRCGIKIVGRSRKLRVNYRTTEETRRWATGVLKDVSIDDLDEGEDDKKGTTSLMRGVNPTVHCFDSFEQEMEYLIGLVPRLKDQEPLSSTCLVARTNSALKRYGKVLMDNKIEVYPIKRSQAEDRTASGLRLATMHRVKGLEFDTIIIAGANQKAIPLSASLESTDDPAERKDRELRERTLFYVAATRAKKEVIVTSYGRVSSFLEEGLF